MNQPADHLGVRHALTTGAHIPADAVGDADIPLKGLICERFAV